MDVNQTVKHWSKGRKKYIYSLCCPILGELKYIGSTYDLKSRYNTHCEVNFDSTLNKKDHWVVSLYQQGEFPIMRGIYSYPDVFKTEFEKLIIKEAIDMGCDLVNTQIPKSIPQKIQTAFDNGIKVGAIHEIDVAHFRPWHPISHYFSVFDRTKYEKMKDKAIVDPVRYSEEMLDEVIRNLMSPVLA